MKCTNFVFKGEEDLDIYTYKWESEDSNLEIKGIVQIAHGMAETAKRYERFAEELTQNGYKVYINDHRGHGKTANTLNNVGHLAEKDGFKCLLMDISKLTDIIKQENKGLPIYLFGHSMGSFVSQNYIMEYGYKIDGLILSGSNGDRGPILNIAEKVAKREVKKHGRRAKSRKLDRLIFGGNNKKFKPARTEFDWLSRDEQEVDKYINDEFCGGVFTAGFFHDLINGLKIIENRENLKKVPLDLPIYIMSGDKDPVGRNGKGVLNLKDRYKRLGVKNLSYKLYKDGRHEMLNEINRDQVTMDIINWLNQINKR